MILLLFIIFIFNFIIGYVLTKKFFNLLSMYNLIWAIVIVLYLFQLSGLQTNLSNETIKLFILTTLCFSLFFIIFYKISIYKNVKEENKKSVSQNIITKMFIFWIFVEIIEVIYSGGIPLIWLFTNNEKTYMDFGIPSIHGFMNAIGLVILMLAFYSIVATKDQKNKRSNIFIIIFVLLVYTVYITRQVVISGLIQMLIIYIFTDHKLNIKKVLLYSFFGIILFGILGNIRTGYNSFLSVSLIKTKVSPIFVGFYWVYMYLTMSVSNINNAVVLGINHYGGIQYLAQVYLPTIISNTIFTSESIAVPSVLVSKAYTVSGYYIFFYTTFGKIGACFISGVYGLLGAIFSKKLKNNVNEKNILYYAVFMQIILLSFFYNHLLYLPSGFQLVIIYILFKIIKNDKIKE